MATPTTATPRREPRRNIAVPVRIFGLDASGKPVNCECATVDISMHGVRVAGVQHWKRPGEIVGLRHGAEKGRFRIVWIGQTGTEYDSQIGLQAVEVSNHFWGLNMPQFPKGAQTTAIGSRVGSMMEATPPSRLGLPTSTGISAAADQRRFQRLRCNGGAKIVVSGVNHWGTVIDISSGGCYVECPSTYPAGQLVYVRLGIDNFNFESEAAVRVSHPGMGMGLEFLRINTEQKRKLEDYLSELSQDPGRLRR